MDENDRKVKSVLLFFFDIMKNRWIKTMIKKEMKLVITFHTTTEAMAMESACKAASADGRLIPVPRSISAGCGLAWCAALESEADLRALMLKKKITPQEIQPCLV